MRFTMSKQKPKAVVLLSGGLDSAVTLFFARQRYNPFCLIFEYGQRHNKEIKCAKKIAAEAGAEYFVLKISLPWKGSALLDKSLSVPSVKGRPSKNIPITYVPARNIIFLSYAFSFAESIGAKKVFIGAHIQDYSGYPDCRPEFLESFGRAANTGMKNSRIKIEAPLIRKKKKDIIKLGLKLAVPFELTWSCYQGGRKPCLKCESCYYRMQGFKELGMTDPLLEK